jgi:hypothetical protein
VEAARMVSKEEEREVIEKDSSRFFHQGTLKRNDEVLM